MLSVWPGGAALDAGFSQRAGPLSDRLLTLRVRESIFPPKDEQFLFLSKFEGNTREGANRASLSPAPHTLDCVVCLR